MAFQNITVECRGCGASISLDPTIRFGTCPYCGNENSLIPVAEAKEPPVVEQIYPANYSEESFRSAVRSFLCSSPDIPDELYTTLMEREITMTFWPFYRQTVQWTANWTADIGYSDDNVKNGVRWSPGNGQALGSSVVYAPASSVICNRGLELESCRLAAENDMEPLQFQPDYFNGAAYLTCDLELDHAEKKYVAPLLDIMIEEDCIDQIPGEYQENLHFNSRIDGRNTVLQMIPYWLFVYEYENETYYVMQNAVTGAVTGTHPKTARRKLISWGVSGLAFILTGLFAWFMSLMRSPYDAGMVVAFCFPTLCAGFIYRDIIARKKANIKAAPLNEMADLLEKLKKFESKFIKLAGVAIAGWCVVAMLFTGLLGLIIPIWGEPDLSDMPKKPEYPRKEVSTVKSNTVTKLKLVKVPAIQEEIVSDDGETFVIEK